MNDRILIGTSGWAYDHWYGPFFPDELPKQDLLKYYTKHFQSVEINNSFYRLPHEATLRHWRETAPTGFVFAAKASRYITHMKKLKDPRESLTTFLQRISILEDRLGPILFQLPPHWRCNPQRLAAFLDTLSSEFRYAFEFRDRSWLTERTYDSLAGRGAALCIYELDGFISPKVVTTDLVYIRLHGPEGPYRGSYDDKALSYWADAFADWVARNRSIHRYFDNDEAGYAVRNALSLQSMVQKDSAQD